VRWCQLSCKCSCHGSEGLVLEEKGRPDSSSTRGGSGQTPNLPLTSDPNAATAAKGEQDQAPRHCQKCSGGSSSALEQSSPEEDDSPRTSTPIRTRRNAQGSGHKPGKCLLKAACQLMDPLVEEDSVLPTGPSDVTSNDAQGKAESE